MSPEEVANASRDQHLAYFEAFVASLIGEFNALEKDGVGYREVVLYLSDGEFRKMTRALNDALRPYAGKKASSLRAARLLATVLIPLNK